MGKGVSMTERQAAIAVLTALSNDSTFISLLSKSDTTPMLIYAPLVPEMWSIKDKTANMYVSGRTRQLEYGRSEFTLACRAPSAQESREIAWAAHEALNRSDSSGAFSVLEILPTIEPSDAEFDNYNTPVDILVRYV